MQIGRPIVCLILLASLGAAWRFQGQKDTFPSAPPIAVAQEEPAQASPAASLPLFKQSFELLPGRAPTRPLKAGDVHVYSLYLESEQVLDAFVEQINVDTSVVLRSPDGKKIFVVDSPSGLKGREEILFCADSPGLYRAEVTGAVGNGTYKFHVESIRPSSEKDRYEAGAERLFHTARETSINVTDAKDPNLSLAINKLHRAADIWRTTGNQRRRADALERLGKIFSGSFKDWDKALNYYRNARDLFRLLDDRGSEARMYGFVGLALEKLGRMDLAEEAHKRAAQLASESKDSAQEAAALRRLGVIYRDRGAFLDAQSKFERSFQLWNEVGDRPDQEVTLLSDLLNVYTQLGKYASADKLAEGFRRDFRSYKPDQRGLILTRLAELQLARGDLRGARGYALLAIRLRQNDTEGLAVSLAGLGLIYQRMNDLGRSQDAQEEALLLFQRVDNPRGEATALVNLGLLSFDRQDFRQAIDYFERGLEIAQDRELHTLQVVALYSLALAERKRGNPLLAREHLRGVLGLLGTVRRPVQDQGIEKIYQDAKRGSYDLLIQLVVASSANETSAHNRALAFEASESNRKGDWLEYMGPDPLRPAALSRASPKHLTERRKLQAALDKMRTEHFRLEREGLPTSFNEEQIDAVVEGLQTLDTQILRNDPWYSVTSSPRPISLLETQKLLDKGTALLAYDFVGNRSLLFFVTSSQIDIFDLPPRAEIEEDALDLFRLLEEGQSESNTAQAWPVAERLSSALLGPVADRLGELRLVIVADGPIHFVPFGMLPDPNGGDFLIKRHEISHLPSASFLKVSRSANGDRRPRKQSLAIFADPEFAPDGPKRLKDSRREADLIVRLFGPENSYQAFGRNASKESVMSGVLRQHDFIHFATHAENHMRRSDLSSIRLAQVGLSGGRQMGELRIRDIQDLDIPAHLVVLSACDTAVGINGDNERLVGIGQAFMYAGAERVVASLWNVDDRTTPELMEKFYFEMLRSNVSPAAALRLAQLWMIENYPEHSPYYWAGFQLQGEWR